MGELPEITGKMVKVRGYFDVHDTGRCLCVGGLLHPMLVLVNAEHHSCGFP